MGAAYDRLPWGPAIGCRAYLQEASRWMIQVSPHIGLPAPAEALPPAPLPEGGEPLVAPVAYDIAAGIL